MKVMSHEGHEVMKVMSHPADSCGLSDFDFQTLF